MLGDERVGSAAEARQLLKRDERVEALTGEIQRVVALAVPVLRLFARGARFTRVPWVFVATTTVSIGIAVRSGVKEIQTLSSLVAHRLERATGAPADPALVKKLAVDLYLHPRRAPSLESDRVRIVRLTRKWLIGGAFGRKTERRASRALEAAERIDVAALAAQWDNARRDKAGRKEPGYREWIWWLAAGIACDFGLVEVLELVANDLPVAHRVHEPRSLHGRDFARFLPGVDQSIERTDSALPEIFQFAPLFRDVETLRVSEVLWCSRVGGSPSGVPLENCVDSAHCAYSAAARDNPLHVFCKDILNRSTLEIRCSPAVDDFHRVFTHAESLRLCPLGRHRRLAGRCRHWPRAHLPTLVDADKHEVAATPKDGRVGRLVLDRPALRDPTADGTVEATLTLLA